jgi:hypothetical protein
MFKKFDFEKVLGIVKHVMTGIESVKSPEFKKQMDVVKEEVVDIADRAQETLLAAKNIAQFLLDAFGVNAELFREMQKTTRGTPTEFEQKIFDALE